VVRLSGQGPSRLDPAELGLPRGAEWREALSTEDERFAADPRPVSVEREGNDVVVSLARPGAVVLTADPPPFP